MGVTGKFEIDVEIKSCGDLFHELFSQKPHHVSTITPSNIHGCDLHGGDFGKPGSVLNWTYSVGGKKYVAKELVEEIDEEKKCVRLKVLEGEILEEYKSFSLVVQVIPKGEITMVKWIAEFEKIADNGPYPTDILDLWIAMTKDIEAHHLNAS